MKSNELKIEKLEVSRIWVNDYMFIQVEPHENNYCEFFLCHSKFTSRLSLFGSCMPKIENEDMMIELAAMGYNEKRFEYMDMLEEET